MEGRDLVSEMFAFKRWCLRKTIYLGGKRGELQLGIDMIKCLAG